AEAVAVIDRAGEDVGDGLDAAMGMPGKAGAVVLGPIVAEIGEQEERIELARFAEAEGAGELDARAFPGRRRLDDPFHGSNRHEGVLFGWGCALWGSLGDELRKRGGGGGALGRRLIGFSWGRAVSRAVFRRRSIKPNDGPCQRLRTGGKQVPPFRDYALSSGR